MLGVVEAYSLLSALISPHGAPATTDRAWRTGRFELVRSDVQVGELRRPNRSPTLKAFLSSHQAGSMINDQQRAIVLGQLTSTFEPDGPGDAFLLSMASDGQADFLVTGDRLAGLLQRGASGRTRILTPAAFCAEVLG